MINQSTIKMVQGISEGIEGLKEIRVLGNEKHFFKKVRDAAKEIKRFMALQQVTQVAPRYLLEVMMVSN